MSKSNETLSVLVFTLVLTLLFHQQQLGLNLLIAEGLLFAWLWKTKQYRFEGSYPRFTGILLLVTAIGTVVTHSIFSYILHFLVLFLFVGMLLYPQAKSLLTALGQAFSNLFGAPSRFLEDLFESTWKGKQLGGLLWRLRIFLIPLFVIGVFVSIYSSSNADFNELTNQSLGFVSNLFDGLFSRIDFGLVVTLFLCLLISVYLLKRRASKLLIEWEEQANEELAEPKKMKLKSLKNDYQAGLFLLVTLNIILLILNVLEMKMVWFGFEWQGSFLKGFVHDATYLLILSILISMAVVLYFFRGGLNFYAQNRWLKLLSYAWLVQNGILVLSVAIRNYWYIYHFNLAYKRIGVMLFLLLCLYGLYSIFVKVRDRKSAFYLFKTNTYVLVLVLSVSSLINWDGLIAKYNFAHADRAFLHFDFMSSLSDKALPYLQSTAPELDEIVLFKHEKFPFVHDELGTQGYLRKMNYRRKNFIEEWETKSFLEWNWPEYQAYRKLTMSNVQ